jgi:pectinesterase
MLPRIGISAVASLLLLGLAGCGPGSPEPGGRAGNGGGQGGTGAGTSGAAAGTTGTGGSGGALGTGGTGPAGAGGGGNASGGGGEGGATAGTTGNGGSAAGRGGASGSAGANGGSGGANGGASGRGGTTGAGGAAGSTAGAGGGTGGSSGGATAGRGGQGGGAGTTGAAGATGACATPHASTSTRPQLSNTDAANYTIAKYLASGPDAWDPTAGLGAASSFTPSFTVAADGSGTHTTVQAALTAAASGSARRYILIKPGTYRETISISGSTPITLYGADTDATRVVIVNGKSAGDAGGTAQSSTFTTKATGLQLMNLTVSNDFATPASGSNIQAVALYTTGDKTVLQNVRLHGFQDTLYVDSPSPTAIARVYIKDSYVEGDTDFIFGRAVLVVDGGTIHYLSSRKGTGSGVHFAPSTHVDNMYGFLAVHVSFTADASAPSNKISLGRSWDQSSTTPTPNGQAVIRESTLGAHIALTAPWAAAATSGRAYSATGNRFYEYCNSGPGAGP